MMYYLFRFAAAILPWMPRWLVLPLSRVIGLIVWLTAREARRQATRNMIHVLDAHVLETRAGRRRLRRTVQGMFQQNVRNYLGVFSLPYLRPETLLRNVDVDGAEHLDAALARGKGAILFSAHIGPFDYLAQWISIKGYSLTIPVERLKDQRMLDLMLELRRSHSIHYIPLGGNAPLRTIIQALRNNEFVLITADRSVQGESVEKPFFGAPAHLPIGPVTLSQRTGAALIGAFGWHASRTRIEGRFVPVSLELTEEERANTDMLLSGMIKTLEQFISAHPEQWVVFAPIWTGN